MTVILQVDFPSQGPFGEAMSQAYQALAESINQETGMIWKIWTENRDTQEAGGIYLFDNKENAENYLKMHTVRLTSFGVKNIRGKIFQINSALSDINQVNFLK
ncbi:monooxygenase [Acinetobacter sp. ANC 5414]|uniref:monooxygenase n=1 Tax=Acinetobacter sp. ANC 5414 TaxID=2731251 RepID=UPI0014901118|nr:monooxygenase [Acinetobacter sp. ANC 5414]NNH01728.1 monooxygenase [Acinetobacter sp. ANC 5414]